MTLTTPSNFNNLEHLNNTIREVLVSHKVLNTKKNKQCGTLRHVGLKRSPQDKFLKSLNCGDMSCPVCRSKRVNQGIHEVKEYTDGFLDHMGRTLLLTFTLNHTRKHSYKYLHDGIKSSLKHFKNGHGWRKLKKDLDLQFHYDRLETTHTPDNGFHVHCHSILGVMNHEMSKDEIKSRVFTEWNKSLRSNQLRTVSPEYGINVQEGVGLETYGLKQEQNQKTLERMNQRLSQLIEGKFESREVKPIQVKLEKIQLKEVPIFHVTKEKFLELDYSERSYSIGELEGELTMFTMFPDYENPHYTKSEIIQILSDIQKTDRNQFYLKIYKNQIGNPVWVGSSKKKTKTRRRES